MHMHMNVCVYVFIAYAVSFVRVLKPNKAKAKATAKTIIYEIYNIYYPANVQSSKTVGVQEASDESSTACSLAHIL